MVNSSPLMGDVDRERNKYRKMDASVVNTGTEYYSDVLKEYGCLLVKTPTKAGKIY